MHRKTVATLLSGALLFTIVSPVSALTVEEKPYATPTVRSGETFAELFARKSLNLKLEEKERAGKKVTKVNIREKDPGAYLVVSSYEVVPREITWKEDIYTFSSGNNLHFKNFEEIVLERFYEEVTLERTGAVITRLRLPVEITVSGYKDYYRDCPRRMQGKRCGITEELYDAFVRRNGEAVQLDGKIRSIETQYESGGYNAEKTPETITGVEIQVKITSLNGVPVSEIFKEKYGSESDD